MPGGSTTLRAVAVVGRWGTPGTPLLPRSLRQAFARTPLPAAVSTALALPAAATVARLETATWSETGRPPGPVTEFLLRLVGCRGARHLRIMADPWPEDLRPDQVLWPTRLGRALRRDDLMAADRLEGLTYGRLLSIPATGRKSALELGTIVDALADTSAAPLDDGARQRLAAASRWAWANRVGSHDGRFSDLLPPHPGSLDRMLVEAAGDPGGRLARALAHALPAVLARAEQLGAEPLDDAVARLRRALGISERDLAVAVARHDRSGGSQRKLQNVGQQFSVSKERARQITDRTIQRLQGAYLPQLEPAGRLLGGAAPVTATEAAGRLVDDGLSSAPIEPTVVAALAELLGYPVPFQVDAGDGPPLVVPPGLAVSRTTMAAAGRLGLRDGLFSVDQVVAVVDHPTDPALRRHLPAVVRLVLRSSPTAVHLADDWFWLPGQRPGCHCVRNVSRRMLAVSSPLGLAVSRAGLIRQRHGVRVAEVPPPEVLAAYYDAHPEFVLDRGTVRPAGPLDPAVLLTPAERAVVATLRDAPAGRLSRTALERGAVARGVDRRQFDSLITYTPVVDHPERDVWRLRS